MNVNNNGHIVINYDTFSIILCNFYYARFYFKTVMETNKKNNIYDKNISKSSVVINLIIYYIKQGIKFL